MIFPVSVYLCSGPACGHTINPRRGTPFGIRAGIEEQCLVGPLGERVGVHEALRPRRLEAGDQGGRLLE